MVVVVVTVDQHCPTWRVAGVRDEVVRCKGGGGRAWPAVASLPVWKVRRLCVQECVHQMVGPDAGQIGLAEQSVTAA